MARDAPPFKPRCTPPARGQEVAPGGRATPGIVTLFFTPPRPELRGIIRSHAKKGEGGGVCDPRVFCASKMPNFLARWRVRGRPAVRGPAGTGSVGDGGQGRVVPTNIACISVCGKKKILVPHSPALSPCVWNKKICSRKKRSHAATNWPGGSYHKPADESSCILPFVQLPRNPPRFLWISCVPSLLLLHLSSCTQRPPICFVSLSVAEDRKCSAPKKIVKSATFHTVLPAVCPSSCRIQTEAARLRGIVLLERALEMKQSFLPFAAESARLEQLVLATAPAQEYLSVWASDRRHSGRRMGVLTLA